MLPDGLNSASGRASGGVDPLTGMTVGRYTLVARLGGGAMGTVYKAHDLRLDRFVALKFLTPRLSRDETARQLLLLEAQVASALSHRNVCIIHDIESTDDGQVFVVMAFYEGQTLKQRLERGALDVREALDLASQIADGLAYIHGRGLVHCDIKPSNLMLTDEGIKILDFGLATSGKALRLGLSDSTTAGTVAYAAPEQARGEPAEARSDIWALGVVLYEMLTGHLPFTGAYPESISYAVRYDPVPALHAAGVEIPGSVERLVLRALEKDRNHRFLSAMELASELRLVQKDIAREGAAFREIRRANLSGTTISHYKITKRLGIGGMGVVYEADDVRLGRRVALKFVADDLADNPDAVRRLKREAETIALLNHPQICAVYETHEHQGRLCIVMERLEGSNLKRHMLQHKLATAQIVDIAVQITEALEAVHSRGIVHRDIKPGNVFVSSSGFVKVLDFGLARPFRIGDEDTTGMNGSTIPGRPIGTLNYMAPERILQMAVDSRSDLFSLGVVIYEMATERLPFAGASPAETVSRVLDGAPTPLRALEPERPVLLERIVNKLLAKRADERYQSAAELRRALRRIATAAGPSVDRAENISCLEGFGDDDSTMSCHGLRVAGGCR